MEFLGVGPMELAFIILIALVLIGPRDLAKTARSVGRFLNRMYRSEAWKTLNQASQNLRTLPNRLAREAELEDLKEIKQTLTETRAALNPSASSTPQAGDAGPKPVQTNGGTQTSGEQQTGPSPSGTSIAEGMRAWTEPAHQQDTAAGAPGRTQPKDEG